MKKILTTIGVIFFFLIASLILIPAFMNWSTYKPEILAKIKEYTHLDAEIKGKLKLRLLPTPAFAIQHVHLKAPKGCKEGNFISLKSLETHLSLASLISGKIDISSARLVNPHLLIDTADTCVYPFLRKVTKANKIQAQHEESSAVSLFSQTSTRPTVKLSSLHIDDGVLSVYKGQEKEITLKQLSFDASFEDLSGPYRLTGEGHFQGHDIDINLNIGKYDLTQTSTILNLKLGKDVINLDGHAHFVAGSPHFKGQISAKLLNKDGVFENVHQLLPSELRRKMKLEGDIHISTQELMVTDMQFDWAKLHGVGGFSALFSNEVKLRGELKLQPFSVDPFLKKMTVAETSFFKKAYAADPTSTLPQNIDLILTVFADDITVADQVLKKSQASLILQQGVVSLKDISTGLPFGAALDANLSFGSDAAYTGDVKVNMPNTYPYLAALDIQAPKGRLKNCLLSAKIQGNSSLLNYSDLDVRFDESILTGEGVIRFDDFGLAARLNIDQLDLDPYLNFVSLGRPHLRRTGLKETSFPPLNIELFCQNFRVNEINLDDLKAIFKYEDDNLSFSDFKCTYDSLICEASGTVEKIGQDPFLDLSGLAKGNLEKIGNVEISGGLKGALSSLAMTSHFFIYGATGNFEGSFNAENPFDTLSGNLKMSHPEAGFLFGDREGMGAFALDTDLISKNQIVSLSQLKGAIGQHVLSGEASVDFAHDRPFVRADLDLGNVNLAQFNEPKSPFRLRKTAYRGQKADSFSTEPFNMHFWHVFDADFSFKAREFIFEDIPFQNVKLKMRLDQGHLQSDQLSAQLFRGKLKGKIGFILHESPQLTSSFQLRQLDMKLAQNFFGAATKLSGLLNAELVMQGKGKSPYQLMSSLTGQANIKLNQAVIHGLDLNKVQRKLSTYDELIDLVGLMSTIKEEGNTPLTKAKGSFYISQGRATTDDMVITCEGGTGHIRGAVILPEKSLDMTADFKLSGDHNFPSLKARFHGPWVAPHTDFDTSALQRFVLGKGLTKSKKKEKGSKKVLKNLLGGLLPDANKEEEPESFGGAEMVTDLLQGLF